MEIVRKKPMRLMIGSKRGRWRANQGVESADRDFAMLKPKAVARDKGACVFCGVKIKGMHVHHINDNHEDNRQENFATVDDLCHAVNHVGLLGKSGSIVYMPGVSQVDISHLIRTAVVAISFGGEIGNKAQRLIDLMIERFSVPVAQIFGTSNPADFGNALIALSDDDYAARDKVLRDIRIMFKSGPLSDFAARARESAYDNLKPELWQGVFDAFMEKEDSQ
jgi:intracellular multiplication protein IcmJ